MIAGIALLLLTGLCWVGIAVTVSMAAERRLDMGYIMFAAGLIISAVTIPFILCSPGMTGSPDRRMWAVLLVLLAGAFNYFMLEFMNRAMQIGSPGAVWGLIQSSLICPFLMGIICFSTEPTPGRLAGLALILAGIALFSRTRPGGGRPDSMKWLIPTFAAFAASGGAQSLANLPSYWSDLQMSSYLRCLLVQGGTVAVFAALVCVKPRPGCAKGTLVPVLLLAAMQVATLCFFFYNGLDMVAAAGAGSVGYPVAQGSCIAFFMLYEKFVRRRPMPLSAWGALVALIAGISLISV